MVNTSVDGMKMGKSMIILSHSVVRMTAYMVTTIAKQSVLHIMMQ